MRAYVYRSLESMTNIPLEEETREPIHHSQLSHPADKSDDETSKQDAPVSPSSQGLEPTATLVTRDPDYEIYSDGHYVPRSPDKEWSDEQLAAAEAAYQKTMEGLEPCGNCSNRKTFCYRRDKYLRHTCEELLKGNQL